MKGKIIGFIITIFVAFLLFFVGVDERVAGTPIEVYQVYLNGKKIGLISSKDELFNLIDSEQQEIKQKYKVDKVYPPNGLDVEKVYTYNENIVSVENIYNQIKDIEPFTIEGYTTTITYTEKKVINDGEVIEPGEPVKIYMLKKDIIKDALYKVATAFIGTKDLADYDNGTQVEINDTGEIINSVYFQETITVKKDLISTEEFVFEDSESLSQYLLFGTLKKQKSYITKEGENLDAIAEANNLNIEELLIANPQYSAANVLLSPGEEVNVGLIDPLVSVVYRKTVVEDVTINPKTVYVDDKTRYEDYEETTTEGSAGLTRVTQEIKYVNGEIQSLQITGRDVITNAVDKVITRGTKKLGNGFVYVPSGNTNWSWPTITPYVITSRYKWRWGRMHQGIDISGTGYGSPIYAVQKGTVYRVNHDKNKSEGLSVYIDHGNGYVTIYMHLSKILVKEGQEVSREQRIALMGSTGASTGTHLHLGVVVGGRPWQGGTFVDPCKAMFKC
ncbi:MAG: peptidoglycan DD-metalloendopeptidase family protein [Bacilli bacterium]|nr:peptidoglycan DD-metalloendopeptidase family protein [Bacilli bacterium]